MTLPPHRLITSSQTWEECLEHLKVEHRFAIDLEANSMYAYRERVCLIQISTATADFIIDPLVSLDLSGLGALLADPTIEKVFHAAEYDLILLKKDYGWELQNLFDTMWAARILGYARCGLASLLEDLYQVRLDKRFQKSNWCERPLHASQLNYAQLDTHYLLRLRDFLAAELHQKGYTPEAQETFAEQCQVQPNPTEFDPDSFWAINGIHELSAQAQAIVRALHIYRNQEAQKRDQPLFKIFSDKTLIELATQTPKTLQQMQQIHGMSPGQVRRYGHHILPLFTNHYEPPTPPKRNKRPSDAVLNRYDKLHNWRKKRAMARGVESDVIVSRDALWAIAEANPKTLPELSAINALGPWRYQTYGKEILHVLHPSIIHNQLLIADS